ncbi:hypothetical protein PVAP13_7KG054309 [Panicum virgatum]|uniref:Uncharacterized protein n=1 Tax=Panicum virgatum TaxID=38727 RepID=A0A8T0QCJ2_PANVG|nr:hypothetical protein PVAP13_7KG054309 [Panicum virgatum]
MAPSPTPPRQAPAPKMPGEPIWQPWPPVVGVGAVAPAALAVRDAREPAPAVEVAADADEVLEAAVVGTEQRRDRKLRLGVLEKRDTGAKWPGTAATIRGASKTQSSRHGTRSATARSRRLTRATTHSDCRSLSSDGRVAVRVERQARADRPA